MSATWHIDRAQARVLRGNGRAFDPAAWAWRPAVVPPAAAAPVDAYDALRYLAREAGVAFRVPVGVIGPREVTPDRYALAEAVGCALAEARVPVLCGGRTGVMEAACRGAQRGGGTAIALLPEGDPACANPYAGVVVATGIGEARNALIARAALCLVAIGDSFGTLSEVAFGRQFGKLVVGLEGAARVDGVVHAAGVPAALEAVAAAVLAV